MVFVSFQTPIAEAECVIVYFTFLLSNVFLTADVTCVIFTHVIWFSKVIVLY